MRFWGNLLFIIAIALTAYVGYGIIRFDNTQSVHEVFGMPLDRNIFSSKLQFYDFVLGVSIVIFMVGLMLKVKGSKPLQKKHRPMEDTTDLNLPLKYSLSREEQLQAYTELLEKGHLTLGEFKTLKIDLIS